MNSITEEGDRVNFAVEYAIFSISVGVMLFLVFGLKPYLIKREQRLMVGAQEKTKQDQIRLDHAKFNALQKQGSPSEKVVVTPPQKKS